MTQTHLVLHLLPICLSVYPLLNHATIAWFSLYKKRNPSVVPKAPTDFFLRKKIFSYTVHKDEESLSNLRNNLYKSFWRSNMNCKFMPRSEAEVVF